MLHDLIPAWKALAHGLPAGLVRLVLADVDGVITGGEGQAADLEVLARLAAINRAALDDPLVPALTLCTGRQAPYVELLAQVIGAFLPCIFEHGAGLFYPTAFRYAFHPALGDDYAARLAVLRAALETPLLRPGRAFVQPGKEASMTLFPLGETTVETLLATAETAIAPLDGIFTVAANVNCVELRPRGIDKGAGARWLAEQVGVSLANVLGVGDSDPDLVFLELTGHAAAPANATPGVRQAVGYVASAAYGLGLLEIVERVIERNRRAVCT